MQFYALGVRLNMAKETRETMDATCLLLFYLKSSSSTQLFPISCLATWVYLKNYKPFYKLQDYFSIYSLCDINSVQTKAYYSGFIHNFFADRNNRICLKHCYTQKNTVSSRLQHMFPGFSWSE